MFYSRMWTVYLLWISESFSCRVQEVFRVHQQAEPHLKTWVNYYKRINTANSEDVWCELKPTWKPAFSVLSIIKILCACRAVTFTCFRPVVGWLTFVFEPSIRYNHQATQLAQTPLLTSFQFKHIWNLTTVRMLECSYIISPVTTH